MIIKPLPPSDFKIEDDGKQLFITPMSDDAKQKAKQYKGVLMQRFVMPYSLYDGFMQFCGPLSFEYYV